MALPCRPVFAPTRSPWSTLAALLALLAIGLRLLLPALHSHPELAVAASSSTTSQPLLGGCGCDTFATAAEPIDVDAAELAQHDAAPAAFEHACFACDFELAHPPLLPAPAAVPATAAIWLRAPPTVCRGPASAQRWTRPPSRAPPRTTACA
jgi:hypothetical protein